MDCAVKAFNCYGALLETFRECYCGVEPNIGNVGLSHEVNALSGFMSCNCLDY